MAADAQILETGSEKTDARNVAIERMFGNHLPHDAIGGNNIKNVEPLDNSS
jgi:hypothetical protein